MNRCSGGDSGGTDDQVRLKTSCTARGEPENKGPFFDEFNLRKRFTVFFPRGTVIVFCFSSAFPFWCYDKALEVEFDRF